MTPQYASPTGSPGSQFAQSPLALIQPRHKNRATYVQRWKVLRERNKNLPKLDFSAKANGIPKKFQGPPSFSRSYTYDSMKLPSISTCSVVTGMSGKSVQSDGYRRKDKKNLQEHSGASDSYTDLTGGRDFQDLSTNLSKSLQSLDDRASSVEKAAGSKHRYERISSQKQISNRRRSTRGLQKEPTLLYKDKTVLVPQGDRTGHVSDRPPQKDLVERQYVYVKNHRKDNQNFPNIYNALKNETELKKKGKNPFGYGGSSPYPNGTKPPPEARSLSTTLTLTPDDVTVRSPPTTGVCSPKSTLTLSSPTQHVNMIVYDSDLIACE